MLRLVLYCTHVVINIYMVSGLIYINKKVLNIVEVLNTNYHINHFLALSLFPAVEKIERTWSLEIMC